MLGFRPALAAPGRSASFAGACWLLGRGCRVAGSARHSLLRPLLNPTLLLLTCAVCRPLRKTALRRQAAADPPSPLPPPPASSGQDSASVPTGCGGTPQQPVEHATLIDFLASKIKFIFIISSMLSAAFAYWSGDLFTAVIFAAMGLGGLLCPM